MRQTWRWFGPKDGVGIDEMMQAGVEGVVSALHHLPTGAVWSSDEIARRQREIRLSLRKIMDSDTHILSMEEFNKLKAAGPGGKVDEETDTRQSIPEVAARTVAVMEERYVPCSRY